VEERAQFIEQRSGEIRINEHNSIGGASTGTCIRLAGTSALVELARHAAFSQSVVAKPSAVLQPELVGASAGQMVGQ
jgi:hypothetical protein